MDGIAYSITKWPRRFTCCQSALCDIILAYFGVVPRFYRKDAHWGFMSSANPFNEFTLDKAQKLVAEGKIEDAYELLSSASWAQWPDSAQKLRVSVREALLAAVRKRFPDARVRLRRTNAKADLRNLPLKSRDVFLLGLLKEQLPLADVLSISPLDEIDNLRSLAKLVDLGLIVSGTAP